MCRGLPRLKFFNFAAFGTTHTRLWMEMKRKERHKHDKEQKRRIIKMRSVHVKRMSTRRVAITSTPAIYGSPMLDVALGQARAVTCVLRKYLV